MAWWCPNGCGKSVSVSGKGSMDYFCPRCITSFVRSQISAENTMPKLKEDLMTETTNMKLLLEQCTPSFLVNEEPEKKQEAVVVCALSCTMTMGEYQALLSKLRDHTLEVSF